MMSSGGYEPATAYRLPSSGFPNALQPMYEPTAAYRPSVTGSSLATKPVYEPLTMYSSTVSGAIPSTGMFQPPAGGTSMVQPLDTAFRDTDLYQSQRKLPNAELMRLTTEELKDRARENNKKLCGIEEEMYSRYVQQDRLAHLEHLFVHLRPGKELRVEAPVLQKISQAVLASHEIDHQQEMAALREEARQEYFTQVDPVTYLHPDAKGLVLGRSAMPLDRNFVAQEEWENMRHHNGHPVFEQVRYAGHVSRPEEHLECVFVKEEGFLKRQPVYPAPCRNDFWLNLDGHTRNDLEAHREAVHKMAEDPVAQRVARKDMAGTGEDALPVDWLGHLKRGLPMPSPQLPASKGFVMPQWMY